LKSKEVFINVYKKIDITDSLGNTLNENNIVDDDSKYETYVLVGDIFFVTDEDKNSF